MKNRLQDRSQEAAFRSRSNVRRGCGSLDVLLLSDFESYTSDQQFAPLQRGAADLFSHHGFNVAVMSLDRAVARGRSFLHQFDVVGFKLVFTSAEETVLAATDRLRSSMRDDARLVYFDGDDDLNVQWPRLAGLVDSYVKKHMFSDVGHYAREFRGKSNLTDYVSTVFGDHLLDAESIARSGPVPPADVGRIRLGWNIGLDDPIYTLSQTMVTPSIRRPIDVSGRAIGQEDRWVAPLRSSMKEGLRRLEGHEVAVPEMRVTRDAYFAEMRASKLCVSPYGFGEICWRDFEAIASGCLLVKPDMSHVETEPNVYVPGVTYVPVSWDYSDLDEVCEQYLQDRASRERIVLEAQRVLSRAQHPQWLADRLRHVLPGV